MNTLSNVINRYDDMLYETRPVSLNEFLSNKYNNVHNELYNSALNKYIINLIDKHFTSKLLYEYYNLLSQLNVYEESEIIFDEVYQSLFSNIELTPYINNMLEDLCIDRYMFFKIMYDTTVEKLNTVKNKLLKFYQDDNKNWLPIIDGLNEISDIKDFRFTYISSKLIESENNIPELEDYLYTVYIDDDNNIIMTDEIINTIENNNYSLFFNEDEDSVILYDDNQNIRIGYTNKGKWVIIISDETIIQTPENIDNLKEIIDHYVNYESNNVIKLYKNHICSLYKKFHKIIEIKNSEYWMPSHIRIINKIAPYKKYNVDLTKYWNFDQVNKCNWKELKITKDNILDSEITEINYINGKAKVQSRNSNVEYEVPFKYLDDTIDVSETLILDRSFETKNN